MPTPQPWTPQDSSVLLALQSSLTAPNTTAGDFVALACQKLVPKFETDTEEFELLRGQVGAEPEVVVGRRKGTVTVTMPCEGLKDGYSGSTENPGGAPVGGIEVIAPWFCWFGNVLGSNIEGISTSDPLSTQNAAFWRGAHLSNSEYTAGGVTALGTDSTHVVCDAPAASDKIKSGETVLTAVSQSTAPQWGWVKTKTGQQLTLFEASAAVVANNAAHIYGTSTAWVSSQKQRPLTLRWVGETTNLCYQLTGLMVEKVVLKLNPKETPTVEFSGRYYDFNIVTTAGGLVAPDAYERAPSIIGAHQGTAKIDGVDTEGLEELTVEYSCTLREYLGHSAEQGIAHVVPVYPRVRVSLSVPHDDADDVLDETGAAAAEGSHVWQSKFELGTPVSLGVYVGPQVGRCMAMLLPNGKVKATPDPTERDSALAYGLTIGAEPYSGDTTDTAETSADSPINSLYRVSLG